MKKRSWSFHFFKYNMIIAIVLIVCLIVASYFLTARVVEKEIGERAVSIAEITAQHPLVIEGLKKDHSTEQLQQLALSIQRSAEAEYVVIGDENEIRYAHPVEERIGKRMVGEDNSKALLAGETYVSNAKGSLGDALRGKAPVKDEQGNIIGVVSVGYLYKDIFSMNINYAKFLLPVLALAILLSIGISSYLSNKMRKQLLNYEPMEIVSRKI